MGTAFFVDLNSCNDLGVLTRFPLNLLAEKAKSIPLQSLTRFT